MSNFLRIGFIAIALAFTFSIAAVGEADAQINEILKRMDTHYKSLKSVQADLSREKYDSVLKDTEPTSGNIVMVPGKGRNFSMRLEWEKPRNEIISVVNGQYVMYVPGSGQAITGSADSKKMNGNGGNALKIFSMDKADIKTNYTVEYLGQEGITGAVQTWHLKLTPKTKADYKFADIWVDGSGMPLQAKITRLNNDAETFLLTKLKKNELSDFSILKISLPQGTKIIKG